MAKPPGSFAFKLCPFLFGTSGVAKFRGKNWGEEWRGRESPAKKLRVAAATVPEVKGVVGHVGAIIDAGYDHVGQCVQHARNRQMHAIRGRAIYVVKAIMGFAQIKRTVQRKRITGAASVALRCDHDDIRDNGKRFRKTGKAWRKIPVVVAEQYAHSIRTVPR